MECSKTIIYGKFLVMPFRTYSLRLDANHITRVPVGSFRGLASLRHLWLDDNALTEVPVHALASLPTLQAVMLALNSITHIPNQAFANLTSLVVLDLSSNLLSSVSMESLEGLTHLRLAGNTLRHTLLAQRLPQLRVVEMPYAFQCCAFVAGPEEDRDQENFLVASEADARPQHSVHCCTAPGPFRPCQSLVGSWPVRLGVIVIHSFACNSLVLVSILLSSATHSSSIQHLLAVLAWVHLLTGL
ncbi:hypothetical protein J4Q44_G00089990 [Coregonus suidteri]|uniref:Uncharacterized protein n=1 Tax=Coregonus suidteri TaxID=861788 RepID=A0AAN8M2I8_9TELE